MHDVEKDLKVGKKYFWIKQGVNLKILEINTRKHELTVRITKGNDKWEKGEIVTMFIGESLNFLLLY